MVDLEPEVRVKIFWLRVTTSTLRGQFCSPTSARAVFDTLTELTPTRRAAAAIDRPASRAAALLAARAVSGLSFGFRARSAHSGPQGRELIALDLIEISLVTHPLQHGARVHLVA